ncbi:hypothetical protein GCM10007916_24800 [Psychromonas marina]|uniref:Tetratricopeptide repeat protein n=1 Tax=Psychromonas marina TaxID=88364 RepID=A0ABQ6E340_9GAMM|nr:tetratricopeptide repeat protein [Psychromonas marina]GLS91411.1 hypothetical protein GCM10007916_24800 [Psychromonas marina]
MMKKNTLQQMKKLSILSAALLLTACQSIPTTQQSSETNTPVNNKEVQVQTRQQVLEVDDVNQLSPAVSGLISQADAQKKADNNIAAMRTLERAIRIAPRHPESYYLLGELHFAEGNQTQARSLAQKAISLGATGKVRKQSLQLISKTEK